ncbi:MAG: class I SAM-dependent methyltransferase [Rhodospirillales bacterium]
MVTLKRISNILRYGVGDHARQRKQADKAKAREARFQSGLWAEQGDIATRKYASYEEYLAHQASKFERVVDRLHETEDEDLTEFTRRFRDCAPLAEARSVLCLGARLGTEVRALHALGHFAVGIDLNPGEGNACVLPGDFHAVVFPDGSVDAIYTNCLDHVFDLERMIAEIRRMLRPRGLFIADVLAGYEEGFTPGAYEATHWRSAEAFIGRIAALGPFAVEQVRDLGHHRRDHWTQAVFRKPA